MVKWYILTIYAIIFWNCRDNFQNKVEGAIWQYLKRFVTSEKVLKTRSLKHEFWQYLKRFGTAEKNENNVSKAWIMTVFETRCNFRQNIINNVSKAYTLMYLKRFGTAEIKMETRVVTCAFWLYLKRYLELQSEKQYMFGLNQGGGGEVGQPSSGHVKIRTLVGAFWRNLNNVFWTEEEKIKPRTINGAAIWYHILTSNTFFKSNEAKWCILTLCETYARRLLGRHAPRINSYKRRKLHEWSELYISDTTYLGNISWVRLYRSSVVVGTCVDTSDVR